MIVFNSPMRLDFRYQAGRLISWFILTEKENVLTWKGKYY